MTSLIGRSESADAPAPIRLGPSAAGRCRRRIHLDAAAPDRRAEISAATRRALDELAEHRERVLSSILGKARNVPGVSVGGPQTPPDPRVEQQVPAWRTVPQPVVIGPEMSVGSRSGGADLLIWAGDGYLPVVIRAHRTRDTGSGANSSTLAAPLDVRLDGAHRARRHRADRLALAHHHRQLVELGCASATARGGVIGLGSPTDGGGRVDGSGPDDDAAVIVWHRLDIPGASTLDDYDERFGDRLAVAMAAASGAPALALPSRIAECRRCPWWPSCSAELSAAGDVSLLLTGDDVETARAAGLSTIADLAGVQGPVLSALPFVVTPPTLARVRARAWQLGSPLVRIGRRTAIVRADVELDVDAESYGEDGAYLWGATLSGADVGLPRGHRSFVTWDRLPSASQGTVFGEFFQYLMQVRAAAEARGLTFAAFCYARSAEERWMLGLARRYAGLPGVPDAAAVEAFCASPQWVDLLREIKRHFVVPGSLRLKELAGSMGFRWRDPEPGGENSMAWYREAVVDDPSADPQRARGMAARVIRYNEDDVLATLAVRRWITAHLGELPTVAELDTDA
ncbi:TM0106 family RecB-like putative nuclease [Nakamurella sp. GG22]